ncbi:acetyltransferase [Burkholderia cepacia]|uniref:Acetyltransferase n=1 Tax=Burkholderia cepacia TaxID=292 RepID=A0AAQ2BM71_BURCE|nr:acetyltransferase [Burkholderia cepacia]EMD9441705.1 acetyltransferase [Burkholderia cepacia]KVU55434.1 sugar O-acyltransferase [Burkholderia cepacia]KWC87993.1 sugar O-acyltransferase [Burkholderia cepacia]MBJ9753436.1 acetyltransferase [Burkholderia cepacia]MDC6104329.1 acetyltransferase [Burkholderia cepacia]
MANVILFGLQDYAELAHYYLEHDSPHTVAAFCVNRQYLPESGTFKGLPVVAFEDVVESHPPGDFSFFAPMSPKRMNREREKIFNELKACGYPLISYVSSRATVCHNTIGENCFILEDNTLQPFTTIGNNVVLWSGNHIGHHGRVGDHVTMTSHVVMSGHCDIGAYSFVGVNATLRDGVTIGEGTFVTMAAAITKSTEPWSVYKGNPAVKLAMASTDLKI